MLHSFRNNAGVFAGLEGGYESVVKPGGWESLDCDLRGHTMAEYFYHNAVIDPLKDGDTEHLKISFEF